MRAFAYSNACRTQIRKTTDGVRHRPARGVGLGEELAGRLPEAADLRLGGGAQGRVGEEVEVRAALVREVVEDVDRLLRRRPALRAGRAQLFALVTGARAGAAWRPLGQI